MPGVLRSVPPILRSAAAILWSIALRWSIALLCSAPAILRLRLGQPNHLVILALLPQGILKISQKGRQHYGPLADGYRHAGVSDGNANSRREPQHCVCRASKSEFSRGPAALGRAHRHRFGEHMDGKFSAFPFEGRVPLVAAGLRHIKDMGVHGHPRFSRFAVKERRLDGESRRLQVKSLVKRAHHRT